MRVLRATLASVWRKTKMFYVLLCVVAVSVSVTNLQYAEAIENDGLVICEAMDFQSSSCEESQRKDNDNDNETVQVFLDIDSFKRYQLTTPNASPLTILLPEYKNSYLFAFVSVLIKPPIASI